MISPFLYSHIKEKWNTTAEDKSECLVFSVSMPVRYCSPVAIHLRCPPESLWLLHIFPVI